MKTEQSHTPGPWRVSLNGWSVIAAKDRDGCVNPSEAQELGGFEVAQCTNPEDARLIAAAPELLEACNALQAEATARHCGLRIADEAIAKATGRVVIPETVNEQTR